MIVPGQRGDAELLAALHAQAFDRPWAAAEFDRLLTNPASFAFVAAAAGFVLAWNSGDEAEILTVAVVPQRRRRGVGSALVAAAAGAAAGRGAKAIYLEVAESNAAASQLYAKLGFVEVGRRKGYYEDGADALVLRKHLAVDGVSVDSGSR